MLRFTSHQKHIFLLRKCSKQDVERQMSEKLLVLTMTTQQQLHGRQVGSFHANQVTKPLATFYDSLSCFYCLFHWFFAIRGYVMGSKWWLPTNCKAICLFWNCLILFRSQAVKVKKIFKREQKILKTKDCEGIGSHGRDTDGSIVFAVVMTPFPFLPIVRFIRYRWISTR